MFHSFYHGERKYIQIASSLAMIFFSKSAYVINDASASEVAIVVIGISLILLEINCEKA